MLNCPRPEVTNPIVSRSKMCAPIKTLTAFKVTQMTLEMRPKWNPFQNRSLKSILAEHLFSQNYFEKKKNSGKRISYHSGPESGQFVRKLIFAQKSLEIYFHYHISGFFTIFDSYLLLYNFGLLYIYSTSIIRLQ